MNKTKLILNHIREKQGLKELGKGCKVRLNKTTIQTRIRWIALESGYEYELIGGLSPVGDFKVIGIPYLIDKEDIVEIIGHEVQLNHLLLAIKASRHIAEIDTEYSELVCYEMTADRGLDGSLWFATYNLTQSVEENLNNNPKLCDYLINIFNL